MDHHSNVRFCGQDNYIQRDNRDRRQTEETKAEYFPIIWKWHVFTVWDCRPFLPSLVASYDMHARSQCNYSFSPFKALVTNGHLLLLKK
jgi:hypothetical protein